MRNPNLKFTGLPEALPQWEERSKSSKAAKTRRRQPNRSQSSGNGLALQIPWSQDYSSGTKLDFKKVSARGLTENTEHPNSESQSRGTRLRRYRQPRCQIHLGQLKFPIA